MKIRIVLSLLALLFISNTRSFAQTLFSDNFDGDSAAGWTVYRGSSPAGTTDSVADFSFNYADLGIPSAPGSGGTTKGLRFLVNQSSGVFQGVSASPNGQNFTGNYRLRFHMWLNFVGPMPAGGSGTTQLATFGVGATGTQVQWAITNPDALEFATSLDGGSGDDYRVYSNATHVAATVPGVYAAGSRNNSATYYTTNFPGQSPPAAQTALFGTQTGAAQNGTLGFAWRDVVVEKRGETVTWTVDGIPIVTCGTTATFSTNIFVGMFDSNSGSSTDPNDHLITAIFDNVRVEALTGPEVSIVAAGDATEGGAAGGFTLSRTGDTTQPLSVNLTVGGTATAGTDYSALPTSVTFAAGQSSSNLTVTAVNDTVAEFTESVSINISTSPNYTVMVSPAAISIHDNEPAELSLTIVAPTMYEPVSGDYVRYQIVRRGVKDAPLGVNIAYSGTAASSRYSGPTMIFLDPLTVTQTFDVTTVDNSELDGDQTVIASVINGDGYVVGATNSATATVLDDELAPGNVVFSDSLTSNTSANWKRNFGANNLVEDFLVDFVADLGGDAVPAAPNGSPTALKMTVNKFDSTTNGAAGVNLYPIGKSFGGDFAVRFSMYLAQNSTVGTTEFALFGINHSGNSTNWNRQNGVNTFNNPPLNSDGIWFSVTSDASGSAPGDFSVFTGTNSANTAIVLKSTAATSLTQVFKKPPYSAASAGTPANIYPASGPWSDVEIKQIGTVITMSLNKTPIIVYTNSTAFTSGNIMLGYMDPYESIGGNGGAVYYSNLRVVQLALPQPVVPVISKIQLINGGTQVQIDFTAGSSDTTASFRLQKSATVTSGYANDTSAVITSPSAGTFRVVTSVAGGSQFYRISRPTQID